MSGEIQLDPLEVSYEVLEQYDWVAGDGTIEKNEEKYAYYVGHLLICFSYLEHSLDIELANLISNGSHDKGYIITKDLEMSEKIELYYNLAFPMINFSSRKKREKLKKITEIRKALESMSSLRNKVA